MQRPRFLSGNQVFSRSVSLRIAVAEMGSGERETRWPQTTSRHVV